MVTLVMTSDVTSIDGSFEAIDWTKHNYLWNMRILTITILHWPFHD